jgi:outer membrane immunogenic protein
MRHTPTLFAAAFLAASTQLSFGADLPVKAPVYKAPPITVYNWTGFYVGADVGYGWGTSSSVATTANVNFPVGFVFSPVDLTGAVAGGHAGYNYQIGHFVVGIEGDFDWTNMKGDASDVSPFFPRIATTTTTSTKLTWLADITGRVGYAWDNWLLYAKGGGAWAHEEGSSITTPTGTTTSGSENRSGWLIGGGAEWGFMQHWSAKVEYNYMDFGTADVIRLSNTGVENHRDNTLKVNVVKVGVSYRF